jgi:hypothetical protein
VLYFSAIRKVKLKNNNAISPHETLFQAYSFSRLLMILAGVALLLFPTLSESGRFPNLYNFGMVTREMANQWPNIKYVPRAKYI